MELYGMMTTAGVIWDAAVAPFANQVGWQGFAYGLLGLRTMRMIIAYARNLGASASDSEKERESEDN